MLYLVIVKLVTFACLFVAIVCDRCDTDIHPIYGVKGTCMERTECNQRGGTYEDNWCMSEKPSIKCCFFKPTKEPGSDDACEVPSTNTCELYTGVKGLCVKKSECNIGNNPEGFCEDSKSNVCCIDRDQVNPCAHSKSEYLPHAIKTKFIHCSNNMPFIKDCGAGTVWFQNKVDCVEQNYFEKFLNLIGVDFDFNIDFDETTENLTTQNTLNVDRCDIENHPQFGKGKCSETSECSGIYVNNWCKSKPNSIKCCFPNFDWENICKNGGNLYPHPEPNKYFQCVHGFPVTMPCPAGQIYFSEHFWCDYPSGVGK